MYYVIDFCDTYSNDPNISTERQPLPSERQNTRKILRFQNNLFNLL